MSKKRSKCDFYGIVEDRNLKFDMAASLNTQVHTKKGVFF